MRGSTVFRLNSSEEINENSIDWDTLTGNIYYKNNTVEKVKKDGTVYRMYQMEQEDYVEDIETNN